MPIKRTSLRDFTRGLITDRTDVPGALFQAQDVVYWRGRPCKRGGKGSVVSSILATPVQFTYGHIEDPDIGGLLGANNGAYTLLGRNPEDTSWTEMPARAATALQVVEGYDNFIQFAKVGDEIISSTGWATGAAPIRWAGSFMSPYSTGTVAVTAGSREVIGTGTAWSTNVEAGMYLTFADGSGLDLYLRTFRIVAVVDDTTLIIDAAPASTTSGKSYHIGPVGRLSAYWGVFGSWDGSNQSTYQVSARVVAGHQSRAIVGTTREQYDPGGVGSDADFVTREHRIRWSALPTETDSRGGTYAHHVGMDFWHPNAYLDVEPTVGTLITGAVSFQGRLIVLKDSAVCAVNGVLATDGTDLGASTEVIANGVGAIWYNAFDTCARGIVFADQNGCYLFNGSSIVDLTEDRIKREWRDAGWNNTMFVSCVGDRIVVHDRDSSRAPNIYVYDFESQTWTTQLMPVGSGYSRICDVVDDAAETLYELASLRAGNESHDWAGDYDVDIASSADPGSTTTPAFSILTHDIGIGDGGASVGRLQDVRVRATVDTAGTAPDVDVSVLQSGNAGGGDERAVGSFSAGGAAEETHRVRANGVTLEGNLAIRVASDGQLDRLVLHELEVTTSYGRRSE